MGTKTAVTQLFEIIKGVAQYSEDNPLLNQILISEKRLLEIEKQQHLQSSIHMMNYVIAQIKDRNPSNSGLAFNNYFSQTYGGDNEN